MAGIEVHNLRLIGKLSDSDQRGDIARCRLCAFLRIFAHLWAQLVESLSHTFQLLFT